LIHFHLCVSLCESTYKRHLSQKGFDIVSSMCFNLWTNTSKEFAAFISQLT
jgi:hypothetical protein